MLAARLNASLRLARASGLGSVAVVKLLEHFGSAEAAVGASREALRATGLSTAQIEALHAVSDERIAEDCAWLEAPRRGLLCIDDPRYPPLLRGIPQPPALLFWQGDLDLLNWPQLAVVGARSATPQGLENAQAFASEFARHGIAITSGLALGIDGAAHRGALAADGATIAVCATGLDRVYPARHQALAREIADKGLLLSEFPTGVQALPDHFPRRNRIIAGLALGTLVVEAARESGSLITARLALEAGREVFAIPGSIHNPQARGCHMLIRGGAKLVETANDVLEELAPLLRQRSGTRLAPEIPGSSDKAAANGSLAQALLAALGGELLDFDTLVQRCAAPVAEVQAALTALELSGQVAPAAGRYQRLHKGA